MPQPVDADPPAAAGAPPPPPVATSAPRCYRELLELPENSPTLAQMAGYLRGYRFAREGEIRTPRQLRDQTVALTDRSPMSFLCLVKGQQDGLQEVSVVHRLLRFMDTPGDEESGFNDRVLGLLGDIMPTNIRQWRFKVQCSI